MVRVALQRRREPTLFITEFVAEVIPKRRIHKRLRSLGFATRALATLESRRGSDPRSPAGFPEGRVATNLRGTRQRQDGPRRSSSLVQNSDRTGKLAPGIFR